MRSVLLFAHVASVVAWVGGMFFAYVCLRPVAATLLAPPQRLPLWSQVFARFFVFVWIAVALILVSGLTMLLQVGFKSAPVGWHVMFLTGIVMMLIFAHVYFSPYQRLRRACDAQDWPAAGAALGLIRKLVGVNLLLGIVTIAAATFSR